jgi:hypothetical protein
MVRRYAVRSPSSGRLILVGGPTYVKLAKSSPAMARKLKALPKKMVVRYVGPSKSRGSSNAGSYGRVRSFCGPAGGAKAGTYPVNTPSRARAALAYARHAPNPSGIRSCVMKKASSRGWINPKTGRLRMSA